MQDNIDHNFDQDFIDHNWMVMKEQLDRVKPVVAVPTSNWTVRTLSVLLLLSIVTTAFFAYKYKTVIPSAALIKERIIYQDRIVPVNVQNEQLDNKKFPIQNSSLSSSQNVTNSKVNILGGGQNADLGDSRSFIQRNNLSHTENVLENSQPRNASDLEKLENGLSFLDFETDQVLINDNAVSATADPKRKIAYNVGVQTIVSHDRDYTGVGVQSGLEFPIGKKLGIATGIAVNYMTREHYFIPGLKERGNSDIQYPSGLAQIIPNTDLYYNGLKTLKQVYLPVSLNYDLSNSLALNSGVRLRYTYKDDIESDLPAPPNSGRRAPNEDPSSVFSQTNIGVSAGVRFRLNTHFSILVDSEWGVSSLIRNSQLPSVNHSQHDLNMLNLTTSYTF